MPLQDWSRVPAGLFHDFHQSWSIRIKDGLNSGRLPQGVAALVEQRAGPREGDVLAIETRTGAAGLDASGGGVATLDLPDARIVRRTTKELYADRANRIVIRHHLERIVAVIAIVTPGNKDARAAFREFVEKTVDFIRNGIHVLVIDLFPPTPRDRCGIHKAIWDEIGDEEEFQFPPGKDRILASYKPSEEMVANVEPIGAGDELRDMPIFLSDSLHVTVPLATTYRATWEATPHELRMAVETGVLPEADIE